MMRSRVSLLCSGLMAVVVTLSPVAAAPESTSTPSTVTVQTNAAEPTIIRTAQMEESGEKFGEVIDQLGDSLSGTKAEWLSEEGWLGISRLKLIVSGAMILLLAIGLPLLRGAISRHLRAGAGDERQSAMQMLLDAVRNPLFFFLWVCGIYWATAPLFPYFTGPRGGNALRVVASGAVDLASIVAILWFVVRLIKLAKLRFGHWSATENNLYARTLAALGLKAVRWLLPAIALLMALPLFVLSPDQLIVIQRIISLYFIGAMSWLIITGLNQFEGAIVQRHSMDTEDNLKARRIFTQVNLLKKVICAAVVILTIGCMLMVFDSVRQYGGSILASAGIVSLIIGVAAQRSIAGLLAGFQIAIAQPIRIDDVVVVEGEWGRIEEVTLTYVVVSIWDQRRLVLPINYFIEKPFQNWTRSSSDILGTVFLHVDYTAPVQTLREELERIVRASKYWDGRAVGLQVTESREQTLELRALASASSGSNAWDLRCEIREKLIAYINENHHGSLPRLRAGIDGRLEGKDGATLST